MKTFVFQVYIALLVACALATPTPEDGKRNKRSSLGLGYSAYSLDASLISHAALAYSAPAAIIHEPAIVSVKKIVSVPQVVSVKKIVSYPHVARVSYPHVARVSYPHVARVSYPHVARVSYPHFGRVSHYVSAPSVSFSYAPSYSVGW